MVYHKEEKEKVRGIDVPQNSLNWRLSSRSIGSPRTGSNGEHLCIKSYETNLTSKDDSLLILFNIHSNTCHMDCKTSKLLWNKGQGKKILLSINV